MITRISKWSRRNIAGKHHASVPVAVTRDRSGLRVRGRFWACAVHWQVPARAQLRRTAAGPLLSGS